MHGTWQLRGGKEGCGFFGWHAAYRCLAQQPLAQLREGPPSRRQTLPRRKAESSHRSYQHKALLVAQLRAEAALELAAVGGLRLVRRLDCEQPLEEDLPRAIKGSGVRRACHVSP